MRTTARKQNYPAQRASELPLDYVTETVISLTDIQAIVTEQGAVSSSPADDQKFRDRVKLFLDYCANSGLRPGIELLCLTLGISRQTLNQWKHGNVSCSPQRKADIQNVQQLIFSFIEQSGTSGKLNPVSFIWLTRNWMHYTDSQQLSDSGIATARASVEEIANKYGSIALPDKPKF